jgi:hypothetical protein
MASTKDIAILERKLKTAKTNREKGVLRREIADLKSKLTTAQKTTTLPQQRRKVRVMSQEDFNDFIAKLKAKPEYSFLKSMGKKRIEDDFRVVGKPVGWRIKGKGNYKVPSAKFRRENPDAVYYEDRINRSDVVRPNRLALGGTLREVSEDAKNLSKTYGVIYVIKRGDGEYVNAPYDELSEELEYGKGVIVAKWSFGKLIEGKSEMARGGSLANAKKRVAKMTDEEVVKEFSKIFYYEMQDNDTDEADLYNDMPQTRKMLVEHYEDQYNPTEIKPFDRGGNLGASENAPYKHDLKVGLYESKNPQNPYEEGYYLSVSDPIKDSTMLKLKKGGMTKKEFQAEKMGKVMHEFKQGDLHSGKSGKIVKNREQAIAIGLSEAKRGWKNRNK